jgi:hypothetical protein
MSNDAGQERAGAIGAEMAEKMIEKIGESVTGFPGSAGQRSAIASLIAEGCERLADDLLNGEEV